MRIHHILIFLLILPIVYSSIAMKPFMYDEIQPDKYIIENVVSDSTALLQYDKDEEEQVFTDIKGNQLLEDIIESLYTYDKLLKKAKKTGEYYKIDWDKMNKEIIDELCLEMGDEIDYMCDRDTKTYELTILEEPDEFIDINNILNISDDVYKFKLIT
jgi:hypothetical protein